MGGLFYAQTGLSPGTTGLSRPTDVVLTQELAGEAPPGSSPVAYQRRRAREHVQGSGLELSLRGASEVCNVPKVAGGQGVRGLLRTTSCCYHNANKARQVQRRLLLSHHYGAANCTVSGHVAATPTKGWRKLGSGGGRKALTI